jgi:predicted DNA-binding ribbon-helix-helix protein
MPVKGEEEMHGKFRSTSVNFWDILQEMNTSKQLALSCIFANIYSILVQNVYLST